VGELQLMMLRISPAPTMQTTSIPTPMLHAINQLWHVPNKMWW